MTNDFTTGRVILPGSTKTDLISPVERVPFSARWNRLEDFVIAPSIFGKHKLRRDIECH